MSVVMKSTLALILALSPLLVAQPQAPTRATRPSARGRVLSCLALRSRRRRIETGREEMVGARGRVIDWNEGTGHVFVRSERWNAEGPAFLESGAAVVVEPCMTPAVLEEHQREERR